MTASNSMFHTTSNHTFSEGKELDDLRIPRVPRVLRFLSHSRDSPEYIHIFIERKGVLVGIQTVDELSVL